MTIPGIVLGAVVLATLWAIAVYNRLVRSRNMVAEGLSGIDVQLKRRANLIPNLVETVKGYAGHEQKTLTRVTELRNKSMSLEGAGPESIVERSLVESQLSSALGRLFALAEAYPDLKASANFQDLSRNLEQIEGEIQMARRYYNGCVRDYNTMQQTFPNNLIAGRFDFRPADFFRIEADEDRAVPQVDFS